MLSYNHPDLTAKALNSVLKFHQASEVTLVHNGSLAEHRQKLKNSFPTISHFDIEKNQGFTGGANQSLKYLFKSYEWVYFITNDCELVTQLSLPKVSGFYAPTIFRRKLGVVDSMGGKLNLAVGKLHHCKTRADFESNNSYIKSYIPGTAFIIHRDYFEKLGDFDETLHTYWEDVDISLRALKMGMKLSLTEENQLIHKIGKTCHKDKFYTQHLFWKNRETVTKKHATLITGILFQGKLKYERLARNFKRARS